MNYIKKIKIIVKNLYEDFERKNRLMEFNKKTNNQIKSLTVELNSIIGNNITVQDGCVIDGNTTIGSYTFIGFNTRITKTNIGNYCSIANNVNIGDGEHPLDKISTSSHFITNNYEELTKNPCIIGNDVWVGVDSIIRRGVVIGDGAVIGANSFVNKNVPPYSIVGGSPAKVIRKRFNDNKIDKILKSSWWKLNPEKAKVKFKDIEESMD